MSAKDKQKSTDVLPTPLLLDLIGPFVVHIQDPWVYINAPICPGHNANLLTDTNDIPLTGMAAKAPNGGSGYVYHFVDKSEPSQAQNPNQCGSPKQLLYLSQSMKPLPSGNSHLLLQVPAPDQIVPLRLEQIWIHRSCADAWLKPGNDDSPDIVKSRRARGVRFFYADCPVEPKIELDRGKSRTPDPEDEPNFDGFTCKALGMSHFAMTLRYGANHDSADDHHQDAYSCFQNMRKMLPKNLQDSLAWRVDFDDQVKCEDGKFKVFNLSGPHPKDCGAAVMIVEDPTSQAKKRR